MIIGWCDIEMKYNIEPTAIVLICIWIILSIIGYADNEINGLLGGCAIGAFMAIPLLTVIHITVGIIHKKKDKS